MIMIDTAANKTKGQSFIWKKDFYYPHTILESSLQTNKGYEINNNVEFTEKIKKDNRGRNYDDYYVFPGVEFRAVGENEDMSWEGENEEVLDELINNYKKINICGGHKYGKTALASRMYRRLLAKGKYPVLLSADDIQKKKIERTTRLGVEEQYGSGDEQFERFTQIELKNRIILLDDASRIEPKTMAALIDHFNEFFGCIILLSEETIDLDIKRQVLDVVEDKNIHLSIKPFLYRTRKLLIKRILQAKGADFEEAEQRARDINDQINVLVKYFDLSPEFIINFVDLYEKQSDQNIRFTTGMNVFSIVYDNSLKSRIINASRNMIEPKLVINVLRELAYYMHFSKLSTIKSNEFVNVVESYNKEYRQNVNARIALNVAIDSKILKENETRIYFRDRTLVAYFVAQALHHKFNAGDDIHDKTEYLLKHLCFGINSDIVLFLSLISNNPRILNVIIDGAKKHFIGKEEWSLDSNNVPFLTEMKIPVKNSLPDKREKEQREKIIDEHEREIHVSELIELVDEYDYTEEDLEEIRNQVLVSFKYLEILSKALPAFCQEMKVEQQDALVELIYRCPNQFLFMLLEDISRNHKQFCESLYQEVSELRRERNQSAISLESIEKAVMQVSATLVLALYQLMAITSASVQSIEAINAFNYDNNANYRLQNLMMCARVDGLTSFSKKAKKFDKRATHNLEKSIIKYTVRDYFLRNNVELHGEAESLMAYFFNERNRDVIKDRIIKNKYIADHSGNKELSEGKGQN